MDVRGVKTLSKHCFECRSANFAREVSLKRITRINFSDTSSSRDGCGMPRTAASNSRDEIKGGRFCKLSVLSDLFSVGGFTKNKSNKMRKSLQYNG